MSKKDQEIVVCWVPDEDMEVLHYLKEHGFTAVQLYVFWERFEPKARGEFDWTYYDEKVRRIQAAGLRFVPFFLMGPRYSAPDWWLESPEHRDLVCLEHGRKNPIESIWNPAFRREIDRVMGAFAEHYLPWGVIESVQPGICGDYGEAIYPVHGNWPAAYHTHLGYWCGGEDAIASFRAAMREKFGDIAALNAAWRSHYADFDELVPFLHHKAPSRTAWLDMNDWYNASMDEYTDFWMDCCRRHFPDHPIYLCTGGSEEAQLGAVFSSQAQIAARYGAGIRLTNEMNDFFYNLYNTIHMHSACEFYGAYLGLEPVGGLTPQGVVNRMYGSAAFGNRQIFHYYGNLLTGNELNGAGDAVRDYAYLIEERPVKSRITMFWPLTEAKVNNTGISGRAVEALTALRRHYEVKVADEKMIADGALEDTDVLIMLGVPFTREETLRQVADWVKRGGKLFSDMRTYSVELESVPEFDEVLGFTPESDIACGGTHFLVQKTDWAPLFSARDRYGYGESWQYLADDVVKMAVHPAATRGPEDFASVAGECCAAFYHDAGAGRAVFFCGPHDLRDVLIEDFCRAYCGVEPMELKPGEVVRTHVGDHMLVLGEDATIWEE